MRRIGVIVSLALVSAACGTTGEAVNDDGLSESTPTTTTSALTTTTLATTTTTTDPCAGEPFSIDDLGFRFVGGCEYRTELFVLPVTFTASGDQWLSIAELNPRAVYLGVDEDNDGSVEANIAFLAFSAGTDDEPFSDLLSIDGIAALSGPTEASIGGRSAMTIDVLAEEQPIPFGNGCTRAGVRFNAGDYTLVRTFIPEGQDYGIPACVTTRVWQLTVDENPITIVAAALDGDRFEEFTPVFADFLESNVTFGADGG